MLLHSQRRGTRAVQDQPQPLAFAQASWWTWYGNAHTRERFRLTGDNNLNAFCSGTLKLKRHDLFL